MPDAQICALFIAQINFLIIMNLLFKKAIIIMHELIKLHNFHHQSLEAFERNDPQLSKLSEQKYTYYPPILDELPTDIQGIYTIGGGRQIGKTTLLKIWMLKLLKQGVMPKQIYFMTGEVIRDHLQLIELIQSILEESSKLNMRYIIVDEVSYIAHWDKGVKFLADAGLLQKTELIVTGSDLVLMQEARMTFPGRRGAAEKTDFHLYPLSFYEFLTLIHPDKNFDFAMSDDLFQLAAEGFQNYLIHGGYLTAINDMAKYAKIMPATLQIYSDWVFGDMLKRNKRAHVTEQLIITLIKQLGSQVSWHSLAKDLPIQHPNTISDYIYLLEIMDTVYVQRALLEHKLIAAPNKAKKIFFSDPFIYHAMVYWQNKRSGVNEDWMQAVLKNKELVSLLVELICVTHFRRFFPTYYIKAEGEVDIAYIIENKFVPIEIKWTHQIRTQDIKQIKKYKNAEIWGQRQENGMFDTTPAYSLIRRLLQLSRDGKQFNRKP